jgi:hypothetical protein
VTETYFIDESDLTLDVLRQHILREAAELKRRRFRIQVVTCVTAVHLLVAAVLLSSKIVTFVPPEKAPPEMQLLWLLLPRAAQAPKSTNQVMNEKLVQQAYKSVMLMPRVESEQSNAITLDPGLALGQALSCGAGRFEYLTKEGQMRCQHRPWGLRYDRYGYIILDTGGMPQEKQDEERMSASEALQRQRNTADPCPKSVDPNAPCLSRIIHGN